MMLKLSSDVSSCAKPASPSSSTTPKIPRARLMPPILSSRAFLVTHNENPSERPAVPRSGCPRSRGVPQVSPPLRDLGFHNPCYSGVPRVSPPLRDLGFHNPMLF